MRVTVARFFYHHKQKGKVFTDMDAVNACISHGLALMYMLYTCFSVVGGL